MYRLFFLTPNATFRYIINQNSSWEFNSSYEFNGTSSAGLSDVNGTWYLHVQAKDEVENESGVETVFANMTKDNPAQSGRGALLTLLLNKRDLGIMRCWNAGMMRWWVVWKKN